MKLCKLIKKWVCPERHAPFLEFEAKYTVDAVHSVAARVLKSDLSLLDMLTLRQQLIDMRYEDIIITKDKTYVKTVN